MVRVLCAAADLMAKGHGHGDATRTEREPFIALVLSGLHFVADAWRRSVGVALLHATALVSQAGSEFNSRM